MISAVVVSMDAERASGAAKRRRERRLRSWLRHERMTVAAELSAADGVQVSPVGLRAQKTDSSWSGRRPGVPEDPGPPQLGVERAACPRSTGLPPLPDLCGGEVHDATLVKFLLRQTLLQRKKEEEDEEKEQFLEQSTQGLRMLSKTPLAGRSLQQTNRMMELLKLRDAASSSSSKRKRKKRRKKKTPRASSHPSLRRAHRRQRQWLCWLVLLVTIHLMLCFPCIVNARGDSTGAVLGQGDMPVVILSGAFGQTVQKTADSPQLQFTFGRRHSLSFRRGSSPWSISQLLNTVADVPVVRLHMFPYAAQCLDFSVTIYVSAYGALVIFYGMDFSGRWHLG